MLNHLNTFQKTSLHGFYLKTEKSRLGIHFIPNKFEFTNRNPKDKILVLFSTCIPKIKSLLPIVSEIQLPQNDKLKITADCLEKLTEFNIAFIGIPTDRYSNAFFCFHFCVSKFNFPEATQLTEKNKKKLCL